MAASKSRIAWFKHVFFLSQAKIENPMSVNFLLLIFQLFDLRQTEDGGKRGDSSDL